MTTLKQALGKDFFPRTLRSGSRSIVKTVRVTPEVNQMIQELKVQHGCTLTALVETAIKVAHANLIDT